MLWKAVATTLIFIGWAPTAQAQNQVVPDTTLGAEASTVRQVDDLTQYIEGGATRSSNLFHSFLDFNVEEGNSVYFNPNAEVDNILSRVTGENPSNILGQLGVVGNANLFLMNPKGILFGENASLDISGSFYATTAEAIPLGSGIFSSVEPESSQLLDVSPEVSFFNHLTPSSQNITNEAQLTTGQNLTLAARNLQLQGQLMAGRDLSLVAADTLRVRDTATEAFVASAENNLLIQGNQRIDIWALQHLEQTPLISGNNMTLVSDGIISIDAHFESGGHLQFLTLEDTPGNLVSFYDPIISADGDVVFGDYTGAALKVEATGSIQGGNIVITGPDTNFTADGSGSDEDLLASSRAVILRAGVDSIPSPNLPQQDIGDLLTDFEPPSSPITDGEGMLLPTGSIFVDSIITEDPAGGGPILLSAAGNISTLGKLDSSSFSRLENAGNGGNITLSAGGDIITAGRLDSGSTSTSGNSRNSGDITLSAGGDIITAAFFDSLDSRSSSFSGNAGNGGDITLSANGDIRSPGELDASASSQLGSAGNSGNITFSASGNITTADFLAISLSDSGVGGNGGDINLSAGKNISVTGSLSSASQSDLGNSGNGGSITLSAGGNIDTADFLSSGSRAFLDNLQSDLGNSGNGGSITLSAGGNIDTADLLLSRSSTTSGNSGNGGSITLSAGGNIDTANIFASSISTSGITGNGNKIIISAGGNIITNDRLDSSSFSDSGATGNGGDISLSAGGNISTAEVTSRSQILSLSQGATGNGGDISLSAGGNISTVDELNSGSYLRSGNSGNGGNITLSAGGNINTADSLISRTASESGTSGNGGNITLSADGNISTANIVDFGSFLVLVTLSSSSFATSGNSGNGGNIILSAGKDISSASLLNSASLSSDSGNSGNGGNINLSAGGNMDISAGLSASSFNGILGSGGEIILSAEGYIQGQNIRLDTMAISSVAQPPDTENTVSGGRVLLQARNNISGLTVLTLSSVGTSGDVEIQGLEDLLISEVIVATSGRTEYPLFSSEGVINGSGFLDINDDDFGQSGNTRISSVGELILDNVRILSDANGTNPGGSIFITDVKKVTLNNSRLQTDTAGLGPAGSIFVENVDLLLLRDNSVLLADAQGGANGGDITINGDFVVAIPEENSDIIVNAINGVGGEVIVNAVGVYGFIERNRFILTNDLLTNDISDISASSQAGEQGTINLNTLVVDPSQGLDTLEESIANPNDLIANSCIARNTVTEGSFIIPGAGNLPQTPEDSLNSTYVTSDLQSLDTVATKPNNNDSWQLGDPIVEPASIHQLTNGSLAFAYSCDRP